ncbi:hypothetical protein COV18_03985 [Candidatus Woesearchaeota archaeon CG10_big_fil_rev_8_21_14_0_10_37_12]|nr:MAG: hypothetical protein COV18_03985 [Candidatus Woesearchaeota archaeon CG10_big_fil_rev_8_21_14_0_10_37_12]
MIKKLYAQFGLTKQQHIHKLGRSYFTHSNEQLLKHRPVYAGRCIGHERKEGPIPSINELQWIGKNTKEKITIDEKGEWLFICGRDLFGKTIVKHNKQEKNTIVAVLNKHQECIGYGKVIGNLYTNKIAIQRIFDIGDLLRRERKSKR